MKRSLFVILIIAALSISAQAQYSGGSGTAEDPYQITDAADLLELAANTGDFGAYFVLTADIDLASSGTFSAAVIAPDTVNWSSYFDGPHFTGVFDGNGHAIRNLSIDDVGSGNDYMGLFGYVDGEIRNLKLENINIVESGNGACFISGIAGTNDGIISNCSVTGSISCSGYNPEYIGAIAGYNSSANIYKCFSNVTISTSSGSTLGGIVGLVGGGDVNNCYATGDVSGGSGYYAGGLAGRALSCTITNCYSTGTITGGDIDGGLIGDNSNSQINNSYYLAGAGPDNNLGTPLSDTEMKQQASFMGWDFVNTWYVSEGTSYPRFRLSSDLNGSGTADSPFQIAMASDLLAMAGNTANYGENFILTADINLGGQVFTTAIIAESNSMDGYYHGTIFNGIFDGNNHKITNFTINGGTTSYLALFGFVGYGGQVKNLGVEYTSISGDYAVAGMAATIEAGSLINCYASGSVAGGDDVGGLAGYCYQGTLTNCHTTGSVSGETSTGGLAAENYSGTLTSCYAACSVITTGSSAGGLVAVNAGTGTLISCYATGEVIGAYYAGGLVGIHNDTATITNCYATGTVTGTESTGGLVGYNGSSGALTACHATGSVSGINNVGGLLGYNAYGNIISCYATGSAIATEYAGGLVGWNHYGTLTSCYATGTVNGTDKYAGGLAGFNESGNVISCYATGSVSGNSIVGGLIGYDSGTTTSCYSSGSVSGVNYYGGLIGYNYSGMVINCFWDTQTSGQAVSSGGTGKTTVEMKTLATFTDSGWDFVNIWKIDEGIGYPQFLWQPGTIQVKKCTITAGSKASSDKISFSGTLNATGYDFNDANVSSDANFVEVTISSDNDEDMDPCVFTFPVNSKTYKKGKFISTISLKPMKTSFAFDTKKMTFSFSASGVDMTGLSCPVVIGITVGDWTGSAEVNEAIVNIKKPIPVHFLMGVKNSMRVDKSKFTRNRISTNITQLTISGGFSVEDLNDANLVTNPLDIAIGSQTFTVPAGNFKNTKGKFTCSKVNVTGGILAATFDFNKCTFTLTIKGTTISDPAGNADFSIDFASFSGSDVVALP